MSDYIRGLTRDRKGMCLECLQVSGTGVKVNGGAITKMGESLKEASLEGSKTQ